MYRIFLIFFWVNVLLLAGCKENKNDDVVTVSSEVLVDENGATIVTSDNVMVIIPPGALTKKVMVTVTASDMVVSQLEVYSAVYDLQPANLELQKSVQLLIPLPGENISPDQLQIYRLDTNGEHGGGWQPLPSELHTTGQHLRATVGQFGFFVLARRMGASGETTAVIGTEGGSLTTSSGLVLNIPSGSFSEQNTVVVRSLQVFVTDMQQHSSMYELQPISVSLQMPAQLTIPYDEPAASSQNLAIFRAGRSDAPVAEWTALVSSTDPAARTVSANITQFGFFVVAVQRPIPTDTASDTLTANDTDTIIPADTQTEDSGNDSDSISMPVDFCAESPCVNGTCTNGSDGFVCTCEAGYSGTSCDECATGYQDNDFDGVCDFNCDLTTLDCGAHGTCDDSLGTVQCVCDEGITGTYCDNCTPGYQDNNGDTVCELDCATVGFDCGSNGTCSDSSGTAMCVCDSGYAGAACTVCAPGYQDNDADGLCTETCATAELNCGTQGVCSDAGGTAICICSDGFTGTYCDGCADGYQDLDGDGVCTPACGTADIYCGANGACSDASGTASCVCEAGYDGGSCSQCAVGYQDYDENGTCTPDCTTAALVCGGNGACADSSGTARCECRAGYTGSDCADCAAGYQDNNQDGTCEPTCGSANLDCGSYGACSDGSGLATCICGTGYTGTGCSDCTTGYQDNDSNGSCLPTCGSINLDCGDNGECSDASGSAMCSCDTGYDGAACDVCASDYQDNDGDGVCTPDCTFANLNCGNNGTCSDTTGAAMCICNTGYDGEGCSGCAPGYQDNNGDGVCVMTCTTSQLNCGDFGDCSDLEGTPVCICDEGITGTYCDNCANGYQDNDDDGECSPDCATSGLNCGDNGTCSDITGAAICECRTGYVGPLCDACATGYQDNDDNGSCVPTCATSGLSCGDFGACSDNSGVAICVCDEGYTGSNCNSCATGYQDFDNNGTCELTCAGAGLSCGAFGQCDDTGGTATCVCGTGYDGETCNVCASGYQDNDFSGTCEPDCTTSGLACGSNGSCSDASGTAICVCDTGYTGAACNLCASGYQDNNEDGVCLPDCATSGLACGNNGSCSDTSGAATCVCATGYDGPLCLDCASGYQDNDFDTICEESCTISTLNCNEHGSCNDTSGTPECACEAGYAGNSCELCAQGYQDNDQNGVCSWDCSMADLTCSNHGNCSDTSGTAICVCEEGYDGQICENCDGGYVRNPVDDNCNPGCELVSLECSNHGNCSDSTGLAICICDNGYTGDSCEGCDAGYIPQNDGSCLPGCGVVNLDCNNHGVCNDTGGVPACVCNEAYIGTYCDQCATGFQDNDGDGDCNPTCATANLACGKYQVCSDSSGLAICVGDGICGGETIDISDFVPGGDRGVGVRRTTAGATDALVESDNFSCWKTYSTSEQIFHFTPPATMYLRIFTSESDYDAMVSVLDNCPNPDGCWFSDDEHVATLESEVPCQQYAGGRTYSAVVSGYQSESGMFTLNVHQCDPQAPEPPECEPYEIATDDGCIPVPENCRDEVVKFTDAALDQAVREALEIGEGQDVFIWDVFYHNVLSIEGGALKERIQNLDGLECFQNLEVLDLPNHDIVDVGAIGKLTQLIQLNLNGNRISDITPLGKLRAMTYLNLRDNEVPDVRPLQGLTRMEMMDLANNQINDIYPLRFMTMLNTLDVSGNPIEKLSPLSSIQSMAFLTASNTRIQTLTGLENMTALEWLEASDCEISDVEAIARSGRGLQGLTLSNNRLETLDMLADLVNLTLLKVDGNNISDLSPLSKMTRLAELWISNNPIETLTPLSSLQSMRYLYASNIRIQTLDGLENMTTLQWLEAADCQISNVDAIAQIGRLLQLTLSNNQLESLKSLAGLTSLTLLKVDGNNVTDLSPLSKMTRLTELWISNNQIESVDSLVSLSNLLTLEAGNNLISNFNPLTEATNLTTLNLENNKLTDVKGIRSFAALTTLDISGNDVPFIDDIAYMPELNWIDVSSNVIADISPLVENEGIGEGDSLHIENNAYNCSSDATQTIIKNLDGRRLSDFTHDCGVLP